MSLAERPVQATKQYHSITYLCESYKDAIKNLQKYAWQYLCLPATSDVFLCVWIMCEEWTYK